jgi:hypothetical protein
MLRVGIVIVVLMLVIFLLTSTGSLDIAGK